MSSSAPPLTRSPSQSSVNAAWLGPEWISTSRAVQSTADTADSTAASKRGAIEIAVERRNHDVQILVVHATSIRPDSAPDNDS